MSDKTPSRCVSELRLPSELPVIRGRRHRNAFVPVVRPRGPRPASQRHPVQLHLADAGSALWRVVVVERRRRYVLPRRRGTRRSRQTSERYGLLQRTSSEDCPRHVTACSSEPRQRTVLVVSPPARVNLILCSSEPRQRTVLVSSSNFVSFEFAVRGLNVRPPHRDAHFLIHYDGQKLSFSFC